MAKVLQYFDHQEDKAHYKNKSLRPNPKRIGKYGAGDNEMLEIFVNKAYPYGKNGENANLKKTQIAPIVSKKREIEKQALEELQHDIRERKVEIRPVVGRSTKLKQGKTTNSVVQPSNKDNLSKAVMKTLQVETPDAQVEFLLGEDLIDFSLQAEQNDIFLKELSECVNSIEAELDKEKGGDYVKLAQGEKRLLQIVEEAQLISEQLHLLHSHTKRTFKKQNKKAEDSLTPRPKYQKKIEKCSSEQDSVADKIQKYSEKLQEFGDGFILLTDVEGMTKEELQICLGSHGQSEA